MIEDAALFIGALLLLAMVIVALVTFIRALDSGDR